jgi:hypothetical protein
MVVIGTALVNLISLRRDVFEGRTAAIADAQRELDEALRAADLVAILRAQDTLGAFAAQDCTTTQQAQLYLGLTHQSAVSTVCTFVFENAQTLAHLDTSR